MFPALSTTRIRPSPIYNQDQTRSLNVPSPIYNQDQTQPYLQPGSDPKFDNFGNFKIPALFPSLEDHFNEEGVHVFIRYRRGKKCNEGGGE